MHSLNDYPLTPSQREGHLPKLSKKKKKKKGHSINKTIKMQKKKKKNFDIFVNV